jgi:peptidyl-dipeptidase A
VYADPGVAALENDLQQIITNFTFRHGGRRITRADVNNRLRTERIQARREKLWRVTSQLSARAAPKLDSLVKLRNGIARKFGFRNYYSLSLHLQSVDETWLIETLNALERQSREAFRTFITDAQEALRVEKFGPWDFDLSLRGAASIPDRYFPSDSVFSVIHRFESAIGFPVDTLPIREVVRDIPYGGLSLGIQIPSDSRFLVNPTEGKGFFGVAFHEYGHSLKAVHVRARFPILKGYEWIPGAQCAAYEEGIAELHKEFTEDPAWLSEYSSAPATDIAEYIASRNLPALYRLRRLLKDFFFEYEMYADPDQDLAALERSMYEKYLLLPPDSTEPHRYAASIWYTAYPCYYQNYILAAMISTQLQEALTNRYGAGKFSDTLVARWMIDHLYADGETREWADRVRHATGKSLETGPYLRKLSIDLHRLEEETPPTQ